MKRVDTLKINNKTMRPYFWKVLLFPIIFGMLYCFMDSVYLRHMAIYSLLEGCRPQDPQERTLATRLYSLFYQVDERYN